MKTLVLSILAMASIAAMTSCSSENDIIDEVNPQGGSEKVEIKLTAGVVDVTTKAINSAGDNFEDNTQITMFRWDSESGTGFTPTWTDGVYSKADATVETSKINLASTQKYYINGKYAYFVGIYPELDTEAISENGIIAYKSIGINKDILSTNITSVGQSSSATATKIEFKHLLSKISIKLTGDAAAKAKFGDVTKITLVDVPQNIDLQLGADPKISINSTDAGRIDQDVTPTSDIDLSSNSSILTALVAPTYGKDGLSIKVYTTIHNGTEKEPLTINVTDLTNGTQAGKINQITLTFKNTVNSESSIKDWETDGDQGNGSFEG